MEDSMAVHTNTKGPRTLQISMAEATMMKMKREAKTLAERSEGHQRRTTL